MAGLIAFLTRFVRAMYRWLLRQLGGLIAWLRPYTSNPDQVKKAWSSASEQVRERAETTRRAVSQRMTILEIEHHLSRLYPQIGKMLSELVESKRLVLGEESTALATLVEQLQEYRKRLESLRKSTP